MSARRFTPSGPGTSSSWTDGGHCSALYAHAEMSTSSARIRMHELEYSLTLSRPCRRSPCRIFHRLRTVLGWYLAKRTSANSVLPSCLLRGVLGRCGVIQVTGAVLIG